METSHNTTKLAQHNKISPMHCAMVISCAMEISLCYALLGHCSSPPWELELRPLGVATGNALSVTRV